MDWWVGENYAYVKKNECVGLVPREREGVFSNNHQQHFVVSKKAPSCMWQISWLRCWIAPLI